MKKSHMPGPWKTGDPVTSCGQLVYIPIWSGKFRLASTSVYKRKPDGSKAGRRYTDSLGSERVARTVTDEECMRNARLIAAAPELLEALEACKVAAGYFYDPSEDNKHNPIMQAVGDAIEKARGAIVKAKGEA